MTTFPNKRVEKRYFLPSQLFGRGSCSANPTNYTAGFGSSRLRETAIFIPQSLLLFYLHFQAMGYDHNGELLQGLDGLDGLDESKTTRTGSRNKSEELSAVEGQAEPARNDTIETRAMDKSRCTRRALDRNGYIIKNVALRIEISLAVLIHPQKSPL